MKNGCTKSEDLWVSLLVTSTSTNLTHTHPQSPLETCRVDKTVDGYPFVEPSWSTFSKEFGYANIRFAEGSLFVTLCACVIGLCD